MLLICTLYAIRYRLLGLLLAVVFFAAMSSPIVANQFWLQLEKNEYQYALKKPTKSDAIVVLSGNVRVTKIDETNQIQWGNVSRFFKGKELFEKGYSSTLVFTGGKLPWDNMPVNEGLFLKQQAIEMGVNENQSIVTKEVQNTAQEAVAVRQALGDIKNITLVTSAFHMRRAQRLFKEQGFIVNPTPVDFRARRDEMTLLDAIPSADGLSTTSSALREFIGRTYYRMRIK